MIKKHIKVIVIIVLSIFVALSGSMGALITYAYISESNYSNNTTLPIEEVFHDQGYLYMSTIEPKVTDSLVLRIRVSRGNITNAQIQYSSDGNKWNTSEMKFWKYDKTGYYEYWEGEIPPQKEAYFYRFIAGNNIETVYSSLDGTNKVEPSYTSGWNVIPGFETPDWAKGALVYYLVPESFFNADTLNDTAASGVFSEIGWGEENDGLLRYGGDLKGIEQKLDYIKDMGVDAVYFIPIWKCLSGMGYGSTNFDEIDGGFGNEEQLKQLVSAAHKKGLKVILDAAIENAALGSNLYNSQSYFPLEAAFQSKDSPLTKMFRFLRWPDLFKTDWGCIVFDFSNQITKDYFYAKSNSYIPRYITDYKIDGYRFDVGSNLYGSKNSNTEILREIRKSIKTANPEAVFINEQELSDANTFAGVTDGHWHMEMIYDVRKWIDGTIENDAMVRTLKNYINRITRPMALCSYNIYESHDFLRPYGSTQPNKESILAAQLLCQTYVGTSWIYYGAENGQMGGDVRWPAFNWDDTTWDYDFRQFQKALSSLRNEYSALRTGVVKDILVDNKAKLYSFGRWDENGTVITVTSQNSSVQVAELNVRQLGIRDGAKLTDYFTGEQYTVKDGKISANVIPGGTVIVSGKESGKYRGKYELSKQNDSIVRTNVNSYYLEGKGKVGSKNDDIEFAGTPVYDCAEISAQIDEQSKGSFYLAMRGSLKDKSMSYGVEVSKNGELTLCLRDNDSKKMKKTVLTTVSNGDSIKIIRESGNIFKVYTAQKGNNSWTLVKGSEKTVTNAPNGMYAGFAPLKGYVQLNEVTTENVTRSHFDNFEGASPNLSIEKIGSVKEYTINNGELSLFTNGKTGLVAYYPPTDLDWSAKTEIKGGINLNDNEYIGLASASTSQNYISVGRTVIEGKQYLYFGKCDNGQMIVLKTTEDKNVDSPVTVQLQKNGSRYSAAYTYDGKQWFNLTDKAVFCIYSDEKIGLLSNAKATAKFEYFTFGDIINGNSSYYTPVTVGLASLHESNVNQIGLTPKMKVGSGEWEYVVGGLHTKTATGKASIDFTEKEFCAFRADATLKLDGKSGFAGYAFYQSADGELDGYLLKLSPDRKLTLMAGGEVVASTTLTKEDYNWGRITLECQGDLITVYAGKDIKAVLNVKNTLYISGYFSFVSEDNAASFNNYNICDLDADWNLQNTTVEYANAGIKLSPQNNQMAATAKLMDFAATDFVITANVENLIEQSSGGFRLAVLEDGNVDMYLKEGTVNIEKNGEAVAAVEIAGKPKSASLMIVSKNNSLKFFVDGIDNMVYEMKLEKKQGCSPVLFANGNAVAFANLNFYGLQPEEDYTKSDIYLSQENVINVDAISKNVFKEDFSNKTSANKNFESQVGQWSIVDGILQCTGNIETVNLMNMNAGKYRNFEMSFRAKITGRYNFLSVLFRKSSQSTHEVNDGYALLVDSSGKAFFYPGFDEKSVGDGLIPGFNFDEWVNYRLVVRGTKLQLYASGKLILEAEDDTYSMGYIGLEACMTTGAFDDIKIIPLAD